MDSMNFKTEDITLYGWMDRCQEKKWQKSQFYQSGDRKFPVMLIQEKEKC